MRSKNALGIIVPEILIPDEQVNMRKWSVVACDQFTGDARYWSEVERAVGSAPSTLHIMLPEIYLDASDVSERIARTKRVMREYLEDGVLNLLPAGFILVERYIGKVPRKGLMVAIDLEEYDYQAANKPLIRATEETLLERIPPRVDIRRGADLETPHTLLLMEDPENTVIEPLSRRKDRFPKLYDFELMQGGGRVAGYFVDDRAAIEGVLQAVSQLPTWDGMRFCIGDGNHSLATAKTVWEQAREHMTPAERAQSPLRYALVELINLYDPALTLKPIHRVLRGVNPSQCAQYIADQLGRQGKDARLVFSRRKATLQAGGNVATVFFSSKDSSGRIEIHGATHPLVVGEVQPIIERYVLENANSRLEYVHGDEALEEAAADYDTLALRMTAMPKEALFDTVIRCGVLPKKSFSLGEANEKRYYLECRLLTHTEDSLITAHEGQSAPRKKAQSAAEELEPLTIEGIGELTRRRKK